MPSQEIEEFATLLIQKVRDAAIRSSDLTLRPNAKGPVAKRWREAAGDTRTTEVFAKTLIPDIVDDAMFYLLDAIDHGHLRLAFTASNGKTVDLTNEGHSELGGWFMGSGGWRAKHAKERFTDDFADPK